MPLHLTPADAARLGLTAPKRGLYRVVAPEVRTYRGVVYDSGAEATFAAQSDLLLMARELVGWTYHPAPFPLVVNGTPVSQYTLDFSRTYRGGRKELIEVKGNYWMPRDRLRWALFLACWQTELEAGGWTIVVVRKGQGMPVKRKKS